MGGIPFPVPTVLVTVGFVLLVVAFAADRWIESQGTVQVFGFSVDVTVSYGLWRTRTTTADDADDSSIDCEVDETQSCDYLIVAQVFACISLFTTGMVALGSMLGQFVLRHKLRLPLAYGIIGLAGTACAIISIATYSAAKNELKQDDDQFAAYEWEKPFALWASGLAIVGVASALFLFVADDANDLGDGVRDDKVEADTGDPANAVQTSRGEDAGTLVGDNELTDIIAMVEVEEG